MKKIFYALTATFLLTSCQPFKISVSDELKNANDEYPVKGRQGILINQKLSFGEYQTSKVKRSWTRGSSNRYGIGTVNARQEWVNLISMEYINRKQTLHFSIDNSGLTSEVFCVSRFRAEDLHVGKENNILDIGLDLAGIGGHSTSLYYVQIYLSNTDGVPWQLVLDNQATQATPKTYNGVLAKNEKEFYTLAPVTRLEKGGKSGNILAGSVGFEIRNAQGQAVAAVSTLDNGMVLLGKTTKEERFLMANLAAALLLQQEIE